MAVRSILVVDDEREMREMLQMIIGAAGYRVVIAGNGREVSRLLSTEDISLVLTDLLMPDKDGLEILGYVRSKFPKMPVIVMSGGGRMPHGEYLKMAKTFGAHAVMEKPFENERLLKMLADMLPPATSEAP
jgi:DNA-binding NtrC family response regulator